jgi:hypothetical protein
MFQRNLRKMDSLMDIYILPSHDYWQFKRSQERLKESSSGNIRQQSKENSLIKAIKHYKTFVQKRCINPLFIFSLNRN